MREVVTIREAVQRAKDEGLPVSEYTLRRWIKLGLIPVRNAGSKSLLFYPSLVRYIRCEDGSDNPRAPVADRHGL
jgi:hypothetical protein